MSCEISKAMKRLAAEYERSATPHEREAARRKIAGTSYKEERDRERKLRNAKCRAHLLATVHLADFDEAESREESPAWISDGGNGVDDMVSHIDGDTPDESYYTRRIKDAREKLESFDKKLLTVFDLVVKNGTDSKESICELAVRDKHGIKMAEERYSRNLEEILKFFLGQ